MTGALADALRGSVCKAILFLTYVLLGMSVLVGALWIWLAKQLRDDRNSLLPGDFNYCHPALWITAQVVTYAFLAVTLILVIRVIAVTYIKFLENQAKRHNTNKPAKKRRMRKGP